MMKEIILQMVAWVLTRLIKINRFAYDNNSGEGHTQEIDKILQDENLTQRRKEDMLFQMLDDINLDTEEDDEYIEDPKDKGPLLVGLKIEEHLSHIISGKILTKIVEEREKCSAVVLKLISLFLNKNSPIIIESLVYRFLSKRIWK